MVAILFNDEQEKNAPIVRVTNSSKDRDFPFWTAERLQQICTGFNSPVSECSVCTWSL